MAEPMLIVDIVIKPGRVVDLQAAADILRIDVIGEDGVQAYELLAGDDLTPFTTLGGIWR